MKKDKGERKRRDDERKKKIKEVQIKEGMWLNLRERCEIKTKEVKQKRKQFFFFVV